MLQYFELVDWQGLELPSAERRQRDSLTCLKRSLAVWEDWIILEKERITLGEKLPRAEVLPAKLKEESPDPKIQKEGRDQREVGRRALAGGNMR
jgi:hypothetical protein